MSEISLRRIEFDRENRLYELFISTNDLSIIKSNCQNQNYDISWLMAFGRYLKTIRINSHLICSNKLLYEFIQHILNENIEINHGLFLILKQCIYLYPDKLINLSFQHYLSNILLITLDSYLKYKYIRLLYLIINKIDEKFLNKIFPLKENLLNNYYQYDISIIIILENLVLINSDIEFQLLINKIYNNNTLYEYLKLNDFDDDEIIDLCYILFQINLKKNLSCIFNISNIFINLLKYINYDIDTMINWLLTPETDMGRIFLEHLGGQRIFSCAHCDTPLTNRNELVSTRFTGATGRAFLFSRIVNTKQSAVQERLMLTGRHFVRDISCKKCDTKLGWMYEFATEESQRYKEGRVILERALINETVGF
ncbi:unnamed protein product [Rotaria sp. Silwood1]|nr:unnamed protein product [Rotaria sp. Silwood1]CAF0899344.1 unnamed protein product [Rotaria sp. Silwood1]CAF3372346.1 unnamed protein product [Rotaria sp. Silwood1]CAF4790501.1 unnamed protein product [Rotaria sp. Silwood1]